MYCLFCDVPCIVCVYMCTEQLPPGGYPIAVKYIILYRNICANKICAFYLQKVLVPWCVLKEIIEIYGFIFLSNAVCLLFGSFPDQC